MSPAPALSFRAMRPADLAASRRLCARLLPLDAQRLRALDRYASRRKSDSANLGFVARAGDRLVGILCCHLLDAEKQAADRVAHVDLLAVHERSRRRGIATRLWVQTERSLTRRGVGEVWTRSRFLGFGVEPVLYPGAMVLLMNLGFRERNVVVDLTADLTRLDLDTTRDEKRLRRLGIDVTRIEYSERAELGRFLRKTFSSWAGSEGSVREQGLQRVHIARHGADIIGFAVSGGEWFGPTGVHADYRGKGVGKTLMLRCFLDMWNDGHTKAEIGWANAPFYARTVSAPITRVMYQMVKTLER